MKNFDPEIERELIIEIHKLFDFFDKNRDGKLSAEEIFYALKPSNPEFTIKDGQDMV